MSALEAARAGDVAALAAAGDLDAVDRFGSNALHWAAGRGRLAAVILRYMAVRAPGQLGALAPHGLDATQLDGKCPGSSERSSGSGPWFRRRLRQLF